MKHTTDLSKYSNTWYKAEIGASGFKQLAWYVVNVCFFINPLNPFSSLKCVLLRWFGGKIGKGVVIKPSVNIKYPWKLGMEGAKCMDCTLGDEFKILGKLGYEVIELREWKTNAFLRE